VQDLLSQLQVLFIFLIKPAGMADISMVSLAQYLHFFIMLFRLLAVELLIPLYVNGRVSFFLF